MASNPHLIATLDHIFCPPGGFEPSVPWWWQFTTVGGDYVKAEQKYWQMLHSDWTFGPEDLSEALVCAAAFITQDWTHLNGALRIIPKTHENYPTLNNLPQVCDEPLEFLNSRLYPLKPGSIVLRETRVIHGGVANYSEFTRHMPCILAESTYKSVFHRPPPRSLPQSVWNQLPPDVQQHTHYVYDKKGQMTKNPLEFHFNFKEGAVSLPN